MNDQEQIKEVTGKNKKTKLVIILSVIFIIAVLIAITLAIKYIVNSKNNEEELNNDIGELCTLAIGKYQFYSEDNSVVNKYYKLIDNSACSYYVNNEVYNCNYSVNDNVLKVEYDNKEDTKGFDSEFYLDGDNSFSTHHYDDKDDPMGTFYYVSNDEVNTKSHYIFYKSDNYVFYTTKEYTYYGDPVGSYQCKSLKCNMYEVNGKYALIYDTKPFIYDYINKKVERIIDFDVDDLSNLYYMNFRQIGSKIYGITIDYAANDEYNALFYSYEKDKITINLSDYSFSDDEVLLKNDLIIAYIAEEEPESGKVYNYLTGKIFIDGPTKIITNGKDYYFTNYNYSYEGSYYFKIYNSSGKLIISNEVKWADVDASGNLVTSNNDKTFDIYNKSGTVVKSSVEYKSIFTLNMNIDALLVVDADNIMKLVNYNDEVIFTFDKVDEGMSFYSDYYDDENIYEFYIIDETTGQDTENDDSCYYIYSKAIGYEYNIETKTYTKKVIDGLCADY